MPKNYPGKCERYCTLSESIGNLELAAYHYDEVLRYDPRNELAQGKLKEIREKLKNAKEKHPKKPEPPAPPTAPPIPQPPRVPKPPPPKMPPMPKRP